MASRIAMARFLNAGEVAGSLTREKGRPHRTLRNASRQSPAIKMMAPTAPTQAGRASPSLALTIRPTPKPSKSHQNIPIFGKKTNKSKT